MYKSEDLRNIFLSLDAEFYENYKNDFSEMYFHANLCHICFRHNRETRLKICSGCKMISYCCKEHQKQHWPKHKEFCKIVSKQLEISETSNIYDAFYLRESSPLDPECITLKERKHCVLQLIKSKMSKNLSPFEAMMIYFSKQCEICGITDPSLLTCCPNCPHANFCNNHKGDPEHQKVCHLYTLSCLISGFQAMSLHNNKINEYFKITVFDGNFDRFPQSLEEFINSYCLLPISDDLEESLIIKKFYSEFLTNAMTLSYALKIFNFNFSLNSTIEIHLIIQHFQDVTEEQYWELILHWLPPGVSLKIVFFFYENKSTEIFLPICQMCNLNRKKLSIKYCGLSYSDYVKSDKFIKPTIVVGFNLENAFLETIADFVPILKNKSCPFIITALNTIEGCKNFEMLSKLFKLKNLCLERNFFASSRHCKIANELKGFNANNIFLIYEKDEKTVENTVESQCSSQTTDYDKLMAKNMLLRNKAKIMLEKKKKLECCLEEFKSECFQEIKKISTSFRNIEDKIKEVIGGI